MRLLQELITVIRKELPHPFIVAVKLNSGDYMRADQGGLMPDEAIGTVEWLIDCDMVDFIEM